MANEYKVAYALTGSANITARLFRDGQYLEEIPMFDNTGDYLGVYYGDENENSLQRGDDIVYYDTDVIIAAETYDPEAINRWNTK